MKNVYLPILMFIVLSLFFINISYSYAETAIISPDEVYETTTNDFDFIINNLYGNVIDDVNADVFPISVINVTQFSGWSSEYTNSTIRWYNGTIEGNVMNAIFRFSGIAPIVNDTTTYIININNIGLNLTVLNDDTPPELSNAYPYDGLLINPNRVGYIIDSHVNAIDPETGVKSVKLSWNFVLGNNTISNETVLAESVNDTYVGAIDLSSLNQTNNSCINFMFDAENNALEKSTYSGVIGIDVSSPKVILMGPIENTTTILNKDRAENFNIIFNITDSYPDCISNPGNYYCDVWIDNKSYGVFNASLNDMNIITTNISSLDDGYYSGFLLCNDPAGNQGKSGEFNLIVDTTPPQISVLSPSIDIIENGTPILIGINETYSYIDNVWYDFENNTYSLNVTNNTKVFNFSINTSNWSGWNNFTVYSNDSVSNIGEKTFSFCVDKDGPVVSITDMNETYQSNSIFNFSVNDDCSRSTCYLIVDGNQKEVMDNLSNGDWSFTTTIEPGNHTWNVVCYDQFNRSGEGNESNVNVVDDIGPTINLDMDDEYCVGDIDIKAMVTDYSGVNETSVYSYVAEKNITVNLAKQGDVYVGTLDTSGWNLSNYTLIVYAKDTLNNENNESHVFKLIEKKTSGSGGHHGGGGVVSKCGDGVCNSAYESCKSCPKDCGVCKEKKKEVKNKTTNNKTVVENKNITEKGTGNISNLGVGRATGVFNIRNFAAKHLWWILSTIFAIIFVMFMLGKGGKSNGMRRKGNDLDKYLRNRLE